MIKYYIAKGLLLLAFLVAYYAYTKTPSSEPTVDTEVSDVATPSVAMNTQAYLGFLTTDGNGVASHPFQIEHDYDVVWEVEPMWTALPVYVSGDIDGNVISNAKAYTYEYDIGTNEIADAYYLVIEEGYQERFENLFCEIYDKLNGIQKFSEIDGTPIQGFLRLVGNDERYGNLRDHLTDALVVVKEYNDNGPSDELNDLALEAYNGVYRWLFSFSTTYLGKN